MLFLGFLLALAVGPVISAPAGQLPASIVGPSAPGATYANGWKTPQLWLDTLPLIEDYLNYPLLALSIATDISQKRDAFLQAVAEAVTVQGGHLHAESSGAENFRAAVTQYIAIEHKDGQTELALAEQLHKLLVEVETLRWDRLIHRADVELFKHGHGETDRDVDGIVADLQHLLRVGQTMMNQHRNPPLPEFVPIEYPIQAGNGWYHEMDRFIWRFFPLLAPEDFLELELIKRSFSW